MPGAELDTEALKRRPQIPPPSAGVRDLGDVRGLRERRLPQEDDVGPPIDRDTDTDEGDDEGDDVDDDGDRVDGEDEDADGESDEDLRERDDDRSADDEVDDGDDG